MTRETMQTAENLHHRASWMAALLLLVFVSGPAAGQANNVRTNAPPDNQDASFDWDRDFYDQDPACGRNDWEPAIAYVRALLENTEYESWCWPRTRGHTLHDHSLLSQSFVQYLGEMRDARGIPIIAEKLRQLGPDDKTIESPWCRGGRSFELICLEALARIGGPQARDIIERYRENPQHAHLKPHLKNHQISASPRPRVPDLPDDFPEVLRGVHGSEPRPEKDTEQIKAALIQMKWRGVVEYFDGDGRTTTFRPEQDLVQFVNDYADPFSDHGIFKSSPKIEYPVGYRRWSNSHTFLSYQIPDGALYGAEYTWNLENNTITTHFHHHVSLEEVTVNPDGSSVTVGRRPISTGVETRGNVFSTACSSAVRGIWDNPEKQGQNYYTRRGNILTGKKGFFYFQPRHTPIVNQLGIWYVERQERPERFFHRDGTCKDIQGVIDELLIPLHEPKVMAWSLEQYEPTGPDDPYAARMPPHMVVDLTPVPPADVLNHRLGARFVKDRLGQAGRQQGNDNGYRCGYDLNSDGIIDDRDKAILDEHAGEVYRMNIGDFGYFGINWLSIGRSPRSYGKIFLEPVIYICAYDYGAGYDPQTGRVQLFEKLAPGTTLYIEYHYDAPAAKGKRNIKAYLHPGF